MKNEYKVTKNLIMSWAKEYHLRGALNIILFILWCTVGIIGILGLIFSVPRHLDWKITFFYAFMLVLSVFRLFVSRFIAAAQKYNLYAKTYGVSEWLRSIEFFEDEIVLTDHTTVNKFKYSNIEGIKEKGNTVTLFMNHNMGLRLYKDAFLEGSWEECKDMLKLKGVS